ncbi:hypothetical protein CSKR_101966 [Clonorchis sinensis]|uniref:Uncharacterized protein n=2 Tax=Clonorchis sinensis TaxID=79923 RepID=A0A8T1MHV0_CLOSI|nr:hypothetical protein CSKR_101966 [Clonorchis sinensis]GAA27311.2 zinc finger and BTB domain-containing protein 41 [Clonorchis sinensis]
MMNTLLDNMSFGPGSDTCTTLTDGEDVQDEQFSLCCLCGMSFTTIRSLHLHIRVAHQEVADAFEFPFSLDTPSRNDNDASPSPIESQSPSESSAGPGQSVSCEICKKCFPGQASLRVHNESMHLGNKNPQCTICLKKFSTLSYLRMHIATVHEGVKAHSCSICEKSYTQKHSLKKHQITAHPDYFISMEDAPPSREPQNRKTPHTVTAACAIPQTKRKSLLESPSQTSTMLSASCEDFIVGTPSSNEA